jgi:hypothetical protein
MLDTSALVPVSELAEDVLHREIDSRTAWRWTTHGVRGAVLECVVVGNVRYSTRDAFDRFIVEQNRTQEASCA